MNIRWLPLVALLLPHVASAGPSPADVRVGGTLSSGGQWGMGALAQPGATTQFRRLGGKIYVHELGWAKTSLADRAAIRARFFDAPVWESAMPEAQVVGLLSTWMWPTWKQKSPVTCMNGALSAQQMVSVCKNTAAYASTIGPYASPNYAANNPPWSDASFNDLRATLKLGGALCLDLPPDYYFGREEGYRKWTADAIQWSRSNNIRTVAALFPRNATFADDAIRMIEDLETRNARPSVYAGDVYASKVDNPFPLGREDDPRSLTFVMLKILKRERQLYLPASPPMLVK